MMMRSIKEHAYTAGHFHINHSPLSYIVVRRCIVPAPSSSSSAFSAHDSRARMDNLSSPHIGPDPPQRACRTTLTSRAPFHRLSVSHDDLLESCRSALRHIFPTWNIEGDVECEQCKDGITNKCIIIPRVASSSFSQDSRCPWRVQ